MLRLFAWIPALLILGCPDPPVPPDVDLDGDEWPDVTDPCVDVDGDGYGRPEDDTSGCVITTPDCDDSDPEVHPGATEVCDGADDNCDDVIDEGFDVDGDGYTTCGADGVEFNHDDDCDDTDDTVHPGAEELCDGIDNDCDQALPDDEADLDSDGYAACGIAPHTPDCDDGDDTIHPGAEELCDGEDNDCDGTVPADELDTDGDGVKGCEGDCDDANDLVSPLVAEDCDGLDTDCDGTVPADEADVDGDGERICDGDCDDGEPLLNNLDADGDGVSSCAGDCDDTDSDTYPGATELCDGEDNDCDIFIGPEELDLDGDGVEACNGDCDDDDAAVYPGAPEACDGVDNDCDGSLPAPEADGDGDGHRICDTPSDCHDGDASIHPGAEELCNGVDDDCDPATLENVDGDGDGITGCDGDCNDSEPSVYPGASPICDGIVDQDCDDLDDANETDGDQDGYTPCADDCDDGDAATHPGAAEVCDGVPDNDCDGSDDLEEIDDDSDGITECDGDCDDTDWNTYPGATEIDCDGVDQDCDGEDGTPTQATRNLSTAEGSYEGENPSDYAGSAVAAAGDVNGDGFGDVLVGSYYNDEAFDNAGKAYLVYGPASWHEPLGNADAVFFGEGSANYAGIDVAGAGDVNHDGYDDILIGADGYSGAGSDAGRVYLMHGPPAATMVADAWFTGNAAGDSVGNAIDGAGDVDGDGYDDVIIGADLRDIYGSNSGAAYVLFGPLTGGFTLGSSGVTFEGPTSGDRAGSGVASAGDVNDDGYDDVIIGAYGATGQAGDTGVAYVIEGDPGLTGTVSLTNATATLEGEAAGANTGYAVAGAGDVDGDGYDDVLVGAYGYNSTQGRSYLVRGPVYGTVSLASADAVFTGVAAGDEAGRAVSGAGDVNGDGYADVLIGARESDAAGTDSGEAYVLFGPLGGSYSLSSANLRLPGQLAGDQAGIDVCGGFDSDGDGYDDVIVGAHGWDNVGNWRGKAYVVMGPGLCN